MRRGVFVGAVLVTLWTAAPAVGAPKPAVAALQVALRAQGLYPGPVDGLAGPLTRDGLVRFQQARGLEPDATLDKRTRRAFGRLGRPLLGQRELWLGLVGWDVSSLEFRLHRLKLAPGRVDGRFDAATAAALRTFQRRHGLVADGIAGRRTYRALNGPVRRQATPGPMHTVRPGESFFSIAAALPREPVAAGQGQRPEAGPGDRSRPAASASRRGDDRRGARGPRSRTRVARPLVGALRRRSEARACARLDGVRVPEPRRLVGRARSA